MTRVAGLRAAVDRITARTSVAWSRTSTGPGAVALAPRTVAPEYAASAAAVISAVALGNRRAGSFAMPRRTTASSAGVMVGTNTDGAGAGCSRCAATFAAGSVAACGSRPVRHSNSTHANEYWSDRPSTRPPESRSGAM